MKKTDKAQPRQEQGREKSEVQPEKTNQSDDKIAESNNRVITELREIEKGLEKARKELGVFKQSEDEAREYAESIVNTVREPLITLDQDLRVVSVNRSFYEVFKVNPKETVGQLIYNLGNKQWDIPKLRELLETILPQKTSFDDYEVEHDFATIGKRIMLLNARQIRRVFGKEWIILLAIEDITERKELEQRIRDHTVQLEAANKELEAFSYSVSHDLRAPLRAIDGFSHILMEEYAPQLAPEAQRYLQLVRDNVRQMGQLVDDLLAFSRLGRQPLARRSVAMADLVQEILDDLRVEQQDRKVEIKVGELPSCEADPALLKQVWINLLSNALKFTRQREDARIEVGFLPHSSLPYPGGSGEGGQVGAYFVRDNGVGFDMQYVHKLFGVFQRLHRAEEYEGTGVGLAIVQRIIHRHGGQVWAEAKVGEGATFYFALEGSSK